MRTYTLKFPSQNKENCLTQLYKYILTFQNSCTMQGMIRNRYSIFKLLNKDSVLK